MKTDTTKRILEQLAQRPYGEVELARQLGLKRNSVSQALVRMSRKGLVEAAGSTTNRYYQVTEQGRQLLTILMTMIVRSAPNLSSGFNTIPNPLSEAVPTKPSRAAEAQPSYRNHATYIEYPLVAYDRPRLAGLCKDKGVDFKQWAIRNDYPLSVFRPDGYELRIYSKSIVIVPPDALVAQQSTVPFALTQYVMRRAWSIALDAEASLGLKIARINGIYVGAVVRQELAQTQNPLSKDIVARKSAGEIELAERTFRIYDPFNERKCFEFDDSPGDWFKSLHEAEATDPATADHHTTEVHMFMDELLHHGLRGRLSEAITASKDNAASIAELKQLSASITANLSQAAELLHYYGQQEASHIPMVQDTHKLINEVRDALPVLVSRLDRLELAMRQLQAPQPKQRRRIWPFTRK